MTQSICCDETITYNCEIYICSLCGREIAQEEMYPYEDEFYPDKGGTGHGDDSYSDADPGL